MIPRNSTSRPLGVEERRRVEEQEEEQDHRKDPGFARPTTLAITSSSHVGDLCEYFARFSFPRPGGAGLEVGGDVRAALDQGRIRGASLHGRHGKSWADRRWCRDRTPGTPRSWQPVHAAVLRRAEGCDANRTSGWSSLRAVLRKFYRSGEQI